MTFKKALLSSVVLAGFAQGAYAAAISNVTVGTTSIGTAAYSLANELAFTTAGPAGNIVFDLKPTNGQLPSGNILLTVGVSGGVFNSAVTGTNVVGFETGTSSTAVLSSGGGASESSVTFVVSNAQAVNNTTGGFRVTLPVRVTGTSVGVSAGFTTTDTPAIPVDGGFVTRSGVIAVVNGFSPGVAADTGTTRLTIASGYTSFTGDAVIGRVAIAPAAGVNKDFTTAVGAADVSRAVVTVTGDFTGFGTGSTRAALALGSNTFTISGSTASVTLTGAAAQALAVALTSGPQVTINNVPGTTAALNASAYSATVTASYGSGFATGSEEASGALQATTREGVAVLFPWVASTSRRASSGSNSIIRISNTGSTAVVGVRARVVATSATAYTNPGLVNLNQTIPAGGELVLTSDSLTTALGDFDRGDIEISFEGVSNRNTITTRRLVQRPDGTTTDFGQGRQSQDPDGGAS